MADILLGTEDYSNVKKGQSPEHRKPKFSSGRVNSKQIKTISGMCIKESKIVRVESNRPMDDLTYRGRPVEMMCDLRHERLERVSHMFEGEEPS